MDKETIVEIADTLKDLLGPTFEHVSQAAYTSVVAGNIVAWLVAAFFAVSGVVLALIARSEWREVRKWREGNPQRYHYGGDGGSAAKGFTAFSFVAFLVAMIVGGTALYGVIARDWIVVQTMIDLVTGR